MQGCCRWSLSRTRWRRRRAGQWRRSPSSATCSRPTSSKRAPCSARPPPRRRRASWCNACSMQVLAQRQRRSPQNMKMLRALNKPMVLARWAELVVDCWFALVPDVSMCSNLTPVSHDRGRSRRCSRGAAEGPGGGVGGGRRWGGLARPGSPGRRGDRHHRHARVLMPVRAVLTGRPGARQQRRVL